VSNVTLGSFRVFGEFPKPSQAEAKTLVWQPFQPKYPRTQPQKKQQPAAGKPQGLFFI